jgi:signal transduction histidine kinase
VSEGHEAARRDKDEFLIHLNRELRTSLQSIVSASDLLLHTSLTDEQREYVEMVLLAARDMERLVDDMSAS